MEHTKAKSENAHVRALKVWSPPGTNVVVNVASQTVLLDEIKACLSEARGFSVATLNLDHIVKLRSNDAFREAYQSHSHVTADGNPIVWLSRLSGRAVELVPGSELIEPIARLAAENAAPIGMVGATDAVLDSAAEALLANAPGLSVPFRRAPAMGFDPTGPEADQLIDALAASPARICFLALGAPKQEVFAARAAKALPDKGFLSIGAGLDFLAGTQTRAPAWVRAIAAEWLWRALGNPGRLAGRYAACLAILPGLVLSAVRHKGKAQ